MNFIDERRLAFVSIVANQGTKAGNAQSRSLKLIDKVLLNDMSQPKEKALPRARAKEREKAEPKAKVAEATFENWMQLSMSMLRMQTMMKSMSHTLRSMLMVKNMMIMMPGSRSTLPRRGMTTP